MKNLMDLQSHFLKRVLQVSDVSAAGEKQESVQHRSSCCPLHHSSTGLIYWSTVNQSGRDNQAAHSVSVTVGTTHPQRF